MKSSTSLLSSCHLNHNVLTAGISLPGEFEGQGVEKTEARDPPLTRIGFAVAAPQAGKQRRFISEGSILNLVLCSPFRVSGVGPQMFLVDACVVRGWNDLGPEHLRTP